MTATKCTIRKMKKKTLKSSFAFTDNKTRWSGKYIFLCVSFASYTLPQTSVRFGGGGGGGRGGGGGVGGVGAGVGGGVCVHPRMCAF